MKNQRDQARHLFDLIPALIGFLIWTTLPFHCAVQAGRAENRASSIKHAAETASGAANGKIAFASNEHGGQDIYTMNPDGSDRQRLTHFNSGRVNHPAWSPDGTKIAFIRSGATYPYFGDIYLINADGSNQTALTSDSGYTEDSFPTWSPDGTKIAFRMDGRMNVMNLDGTDQRTLFGFCQPAWSPDGTKFAVTDSWRIALINVDGSNETPITTPRLGVGFADEDFAPAWSPDGSKIVFVRALRCDVWELCQGTEIWEVDADGSNPIPVWSSSPNYEAAPRWAPDGTSIVFSSDGDVFTVNPNGGGTTNITHTAGVGESDPSWQPLPLTTPPTTNQIDDAQFFVRQQYRDFLNREPDTAGLAYWTERITQCGNDARCVHDSRIGVSAAFFIEQEFQQTGDVVYRLHRAAFGTMPNAPTRANVNFSQFVADRAQLVGGSGLPQSTIDFANNFVARAEFKQAYPDGLSQPDFVNQLFNTAGLYSSPDQRQAEIDALLSGSKTRAQVLLDVVDIPEFKDREYNAAFVLMQYFGYLRRDADQGGYDFWLNVLNNGEPNNYRGMVCAFLTSTEYQLRFGSLVTRSNADCGQ